MSGTKIIVITGGIGAGKSEAAKILSSRGIPVYDSDSRAKALYGARPDIAALLCPDVFDRPDKLSVLENALYPALMEDFRLWRDASRRPVVAFESAVILQKPFFDGFGDWVLWVDAPARLRLERAIARGTVSENSISKRMELQEDLSSSCRVTEVIHNDGDLKNLEIQVERFINRFIMAKEKTELSKILSASGYSGLYRYVAQSRTGVIAESLRDGVRLNFPATGKITTLEDIAIFTDSGEMKLREVFASLHSFLKDADAPSAKDSDDALRSLFEKAIPAYDRDKFYLSHMKKVVTWYNELKKFASLDFVEPESEDSAKAAQGAGAAPADTPVKASARTAAKSASKPASKASMKTPAKGVAKTGNAAKKTGSGN